MKVCVLQPDYSTTGVDYKNYDPTRELSHLIPEATFDHVLVNKLTTYKQLHELSKKKYDIFVNLCEGYLDWSTLNTELPGASVSFSMSYDTDVLAWFQALGPGYQIKMNEVLRSYVRAHTKKTA